MERGYREAVEYLFSPPAEGIQAVFVDRDDDDEAHEKRREERRRTYGKWMEKWANVFGYEAWLSHSVSVFHVAGTKGKGSVSSFLSSCLSSASIPTVCTHSFLFLFFTHQVSLFFFFSLTKGLFVSPHLHSACERIRVDGKMISKEDLEIGVEEIRKWEGETPQFFNFFDRLMMLSLWYFCRTKPLAIVLETGMGGRYDPTNCVVPVGDKETKTYAILTSISLDHQMYLGDTLADIASNKAGIIRPARPCFFASSAPDQVVEMFVKEAREKEGELYGCDLKTIRRVFPSEDVDSHLPVDLPVDLETQVEALLDKRWRDGLGVQKENAGIAVQVMAFYLLKDLGLSVDVFLSCLHGLSLPLHAGRFESFQTDRGLFLIDGAHNVDSLHRLFSSIYSSFVLPFFEERKR